MRPIEIGYLAEQIVATALCRAGYVVLQPLGRHRYDLAIEVDDGVFKRVQCKTGRLVDGVITFKTCSNGGYNNAPRKSYTGEIEFFGVYCPENDQCYLVPVSDVGKTEGRLRIDPAKNNQTFGVRSAAGYNLAVALLTVSGS